MRSCRPAAALISAAILCSLCLPSAVSASDNEVSALTVPADENGVLSLNSGDKWYKVQEFEDSKDYLISVKNSDGTQSLLNVGDSERFVWHYYRETMVASMTPEYTSLTAGSSHLEFREGDVTPYRTHSVNGDIMWEHNGSFLSCTENGITSYLKYNEGSDIPFSCTNDLSVASEVSIYTNGNTLGRCIVEQPHAESYVIEGSGYAAPVFSVKLADITTDSIRWFADGEEQPGSGTEFTADVLTDKPSGVHHVCCLVEGHDSSGYHYREMSSEAAFIITKGIVPDSVLTFSDVHEQYGLIDKAVESVMAQTGGYVPSLMICTGDLVNGPQAGTDIMLKKYYPQIVSHLGGLDTVFVSGNHDSGEAASYMSSVAGLGAEINDDLSVGMIFNGRSSAVSENGRSSRWARNIKVYGLNFDSVISHENGGTTYTYKNVKEDVRSFLESAAEDYHGELLIISAHSGLHVLGKQQGSVNRYNDPLSEWIGENPYNIDDSYDLAQIINEYAEKYDMDIIYLFGHDHSRQEAELIAVEGDTLTSSKSYMTGDYGTIPLHFTYAHSGYLSTAIGCADARFSFIRKDGDKIIFDMIRTSDNALRRTEIAAKNVTSAEEITTASSAVTSVSTTTTVSASTTKQKQKNDSPKTSDNFGAVWLLIPASGVFLLSRKRNRS